MGEQIDWEAIISQLVKMQYERNDIDFSRAKFRVRGDVIDVYPAHGKTALRLELFGDEIEAISTIDPLLRTIRRSMDSCYHLPSEAFYDCRIQIK